MGDNFYLGDRDIVSFVNMIPGFPDPDVCRNNGRMTRRIPLDAVGCALVDTEVS